MSFVKSRFALVGAAGYIAPRHMRAIKETGCELVAALDPNDSVGIIDSFFPEARFFTEFERFDRHIDKLSREDRPVDYVSICSPNYLHDAHCRFALRAGADVICEKPLVLNPSNLEGLEQMEVATGKHINCILQLRLHPTIVALREKILSEPGKVHDVDLTYITSRGRWYGVSWKGEEPKSGGVATNIGIHFFDMLGFLFGRCTRSEAHINDDVCNAGYLEFERARVRWFLSIDRKDLPKETPDGQTTWRSITIDGDEIEFSGGFTDLHTMSYEAVLRGEGFRLAEVRPSIEIVAGIRNSSILENPSEAHPFAWQRNHEQ